MCAQIARAWGNDAFGGFEPRPAVELAAERHELGMEGERPLLNPATGLPKDFDDLSHAEHLPLQFAGPERLAEIEPYAGLLASLHHESFYRRTSPLAVLTRDGRLERDALRRSAALQARLRAELRPTRRRSSATAGSCATGTGSRTTCWSAAGRGRATASRRPTGTWPTSS